MISGCGLLFYSGESLSSLHYTLPLMIMSVGIEHLFVICHAIDEISLAKPAHERVHLALQYAGPLIAITTLTTISAFALGSISSLLALRSFCLFATVCTLTLFLSNMTLFLAAVVWDTERVEQRKRGCKGLLFCKENSLICCKGKLASKA